MTDDRDQSWRAFADELAQESFEDEPTPEPSNSDTGKTLSRVLQRHETAIDRTLADIDSAIDNLRDAAGQPPLERKSDPGPAFPWRGPETPEQGTTAAPQLRPGQPGRPGLPEADASSVSDKHQPMPLVAAARPAHQTEPKPSAAPASKEAPSASAESPRPWPAQGLAKPADGSAQSKQPHARGAQAEEKAQVAKQGEQAKPAPRQEPAQPAAGQNSAATGDKPHVARQNQPAKPAPQAEPARPAAAQNGASPTGDKVVRQAEPAKPAPQREPVSAPPLEPAKDMSTPAEPQLANTSRPAGPTAAKEVHFARTGDSYRPPGQTGTARFATAGGSYRPASPVRKIGAKGQVCAVGNGHSGS